MKIGIMGAMPEEIIGIKKDLSFPPNQFIGTQIIADREFHEFKTDKHHIVLVFSRWGKVASTITSTLLIDKFIVDAVIFCGVAGAAHPSLEVGDVVIGDKYIQHDMDVSPIPGMKKYQIPLTNITYFSSHQKLTKLAQAAAIEAITSSKLEALSFAKFNSKALKVLLGTLASGDQFLASKQVVLAMTKTIENLLAVDMESAAVAHTCTAFGKPFVAIRIISDKADGCAHVDFVEFTTKLASPLDAIIVGNLIKLIPASLD